MKSNRKLKAFVMSSALVGMVAAAPLTTNAAEKPLHHGMNNQDVKPLQHQLKNFDYYTNKIDGSYGRGTLKAVKAFQLEHALDVDGIAGSDTMDALKKLKKIKHIYQHAALLDQGDHGKVVKLLQNQLQDLNYYKDDVDGIFGTNTEDAVKSFQDANDIDVDGIAGPDTYKTLINNPQKAVVKQTHKAKKTQVESTDTSAKSQTEQQSSSKSSDQGSAKTVTVNSTAYTADCPGCSGVTATGINLSKNTSKKVIAVDPDVIPLGSKVYVPGYGYAVAGDTGGAINGNRIDVFFPNKSQAMNWGSKQVTVKIIN